MGFGQNLGFHKVYNLNDTNVFFNDVAIQIDGSYLLSGSVGKGIERFYPTMTMLNENGATINIDNYYDSIFLHKTGYSYTNLDTNIFGQHLLHYSTVKKNLNELWFHTLLTWKQTQGFGQANFSDTLSNNFLKYFDTGRALISNSDSTYYTLSNYSYLSSMDTINNLPNNNGILLIKYSQITGSIIWLKKISLPSTTGPVQGQVNLLQKLNGELLLIAQNFFNNSNFNSQYCKLLFFTINEFNGSIVSTKQLHDTPWSTPSYGATFINNEKDLLISYTESDTLYTNTTIPQPYHAVRPSVARLDSNFNVVWKDTLYSYLSSTLSSYGCIEKFVVEDVDSSFVSAAAYLRVTDEGTPNQKNYDAVRISKRKQSTGAIIWNRDYVYFDIDYFNDPLYSIHDAESTLDGGYIFVGQVENFDSLQAGAPGQLGYVLKTNCLGFLDDPQAGFTAENNDSLGVQFTNTSLMGGSYLWNFGDGTTLSTGENLDSVFHQYSDSGTYEVKLIAYGCNGVNDTIITSVYVSKYNAPEPPVNPNIVNYMALGPNPVQSGESIAVYVGVLPSNNCWLAFYDAQGKLVMEHAIQQSKSTNIIEIPFSSGVYQVVLRNGSKELEMEKILVI